MAIDLSPEADALLREVTACFTQAEKRSKDTRDKWDRLFGLYRSREDFRRSYSEASPRDRDSVMRDGQTTFGAELFIPYSFGVIETILPRMLSQRPRMQVLPRNRASEENVQNMKWLIDSQQEQIRYELKLQDIAKSGLIFGLGVQKVLWRYEEREQMKLQRRLVGDPYTLREEWVPWPCKYEPFDDPDALNVDIFDFFWDPYASDADTMNWAIHRTWRSTKYVLEKLRAGQWSGIMEEDVHSSGSSGKYDESRQMRNKAAGMKDDPSRDGDLHEVWEFHDGTRVVVILDRKCPVLATKNPLWSGELPFQCFRPTTAGMGMLAGIGEIEPIDHLQAEMNTLRSQRRDNATLKLQQVFAYSDGLVEPGDIQFFAGANIPTAGDPRELLFPINVCDIPNSGYQEEAALLADIERVTGISDPVAGTAEAHTATGTQIAQAAANVRIQAKTTRLELEIIKPATAQFAALSQQKVRDKQVRVPIPPEPGQPERRYAWVSLGPGELAGEFDFIPEGGSTAPENIPQQRQDAQIWTTLAANPQLDQQMVWKQILKLMGIKNPEAWLAPDQRIPPVMLDVLASMLNEAGIQIPGPNGQKVPPEALIAAALQQAQQIEQQQQMQSPNLGVPQEQQAQDQPEQQPQNGSAPAVPTG